MALSKWQEQGVAMFCEKGEWFEESNPDVWNLLAVLLPHKSATAIKTRIDALKVLCSTSKFEILPGRA